MTKYKKYDQDRVSAVVVGVGALPVRVYPETWISNINDHFIENFRDQRIKFSAFLANKYTSKSTTSNSKTSAWTKITAPSTS